MKDKVAVAAQGLSQKASRISVDIKMKAPIIIVPQNSHSTNAIVIDLGKLEIKNVFKVGGKSDSQGLPAMLDQMSIELTLLRVYRLVSSR